MPRPALGESYYNGKMELTDGQSQIVVIYSNKIGKAKFQK